MQHALDAFLSLAGRHPMAALAIVGLVAFAESLAVVGSLVPAAVVMFGAGALVGHGTLDLGWTLLVATAGAVAGDASSYELGRHRQDRIRASALFRRHAERIGKAERLIADHGAASIFIARFTGAVRAFVPVLAGFARMPAATFYATNVASALLWAPAHILPGIVFGASLQLAEQASGRLAVLLLLVAALVWSALWIARLTIRTLVPLSRALRAHALRAAGTRTSWWAGFARLLLDPARPGSAALLTGLVVLIGAMWLFLATVEDVVSRDPLVVADQTVFTFLQQLRTEPVDRLMVAITELGSVGVMMPLVVVVAIWLAVRRCWRTAGYWLATAIGAELMVQVLKRTLGRHRPLALYSGVEQYSFPSGHATVSAVVLAFLAFLLTRGQSPRRRVAVGSTAAVFVALVGFSRLYLGAHWLSDVLGGFSFGLAAAALAAMIYTQHQVAEAIRPRGMALLALATVVVSGTLWGWWRSPADLQRYAHRERPTATTLQAWASGGFEQLPAARHEAAGERKEAMTIQVACPETTLRATLGRAGWAPAPGLSIGAVLQAVAPHPALDKLAVLPSFDGGRASGINLMRSPAAPATARDVLRLWRSAWGLADGTPIWYGAFYREVQLRPNYSFLRQEAQDPAIYTSSLVSAGMQRLPAASRDRGRAPELWTCMP
jgi:membrane protein DedA with SNARE-associated domain